MADLTQLRRLVYERDKHAAGWGACGDVPAMYALDHACYVPQIESPHGQRRGPSRRTSCGDGWGNTYSMGSGRGNGPASCGNGCGVGYGWGRTNPDDDDYEGFGYGDGCDHDTGAGNGRDCGNGNGYGLGTGCGGNPEAAPWQV